MLDFYLVIIISLLIYFFCYSKGYLSISLQGPVAKLTLSHHSHVEFKTCIFSNNNNLVISARQQNGYEFKSALNTNTSGLLQQSLQQYLPTKNLLIELQSNLLCEIIWQQQQQCINPRASKQFLPQKLFQGDELSMQTNKNVPIDVVDRELQIRFQSVTGNSWSETGRALNLEMMTILAKKMQRRTHHVVNDLSSITLACLCGENSQNLLTVLDFFHMGVSPGC